MKSKTINLFESMQANLNDNTITVEEFNIEDLGGNTLAVFGKLSNGRYFAGNENYIDLYSKDVRPLYIDDEYTDENISDLLEVLHILTYDNTSDEFKSIMDQTGFMKTEECDKPKFAKPINEDYSGLDDEEKEAMIKRVEDATGYDLEECKRIVEDGDYVWFSGVDNEKDLGKAYVDMVGISGVGHVEQYIDEDKVKEEIKEFLDDEGEEYTEADLNAAVDIDIQDAISIGDEKYLSRNFDYEALGRDLHIEEYYFVEDGCIGIFN